MKGYSLINFWQISHEVGRCGERLLAFLTSLTELLGNDRAKYAALSKLISRSSTTRFGLGNPEGEYSRSHNYVLRIGSVKNPSAGPCFRVAKIRLLQREDAYLLGGHL